MRVGQLLGSQMACSPHAAPLSPKLRSTLEDGTPASGGRGRMSWVVSSRGWPIFSAASAAGGKESMGNGHARGPKLLSPIQ